MRIRIVAALGAVAALAIAAGPATAADDHAALTCPGAQATEHGSKVDGAWQRDFPFDAWVAAGLEPREWATNGGRHTLTFSHGLWVDHDDAPGNPPDACGPFTLRHGVLTVVITAVGDQAIGEELLLFSARARRHGHVLELASRSALDEIAAYVFDGSWQRAR